MPVDSSGEDVAGLDETLLMLSQAARKGAVSAMTSLLKYHMDLRARNGDEDKPEDPFVGLDELAQKRQAA